MPKKRPSAIPPKLTESEKDLLAHIEHGYQLETDPLRGNPVLRSPKGNKVLRPADANASIVKALEKRGLICHGEGPDPLTIAWSLNSEKSQPNKPRRR